MPSKSKTTSPTFDDSEVKETMLSLYEDLRSAVLRIRINEVAIKKLFKAKSITIADEISETLLICLQTIQADIIVCMDLMRELTQCNNDNDLIDLLNAYREGNPLIQEVDN